MKFLVKDSEVIFGCKKREGRRGGERKKIKVENSIFFCVFGKELLKERNRIFFV